MEREAAADGSVVVCRWARDRRSAGRARAALRKSLAEWGLSAIEDRAVLVLSELVTNAVLHGGPPGREVETRWSPTAEGLRVEVHDAGDGRPELRAPEPDSEGGRGLHLVAALAHRWAVGERCGPGKVVWAEVHAQEPDSRGRNGSGRVPVG